MFDPFGTVSMTGPDRCRHSDASPEDGFCQCDRQVDMNIVAMASEEPMRVDRNFHQRVACLTLTEGWSSLPAKAQNLSLLHSGRNCYVERSTVR